MTFLQKHEKTLARIVMILLCLLTIMRLHNTWRGAGFGDTRYFVETSRLILQGVSPYHPETNPTKYKYPLQSPGMSILSMPFCLTSQAFQNFFFFLGGMLAFLLYTLMVFRYYGYDFRRYLEAKWKNLPIWLVLTTILISPPHTMMLKHGQNSSFCALLLFMALLYPQHDNSTNIILLGIAAAMKYSLLTAQVPVLLLQRKRWIVCMGSFLLFLTLVLSVGFWLDGIVPAFTDYIKLVINDTQSGVNSTISYNLTHVCFFRNNNINILIKGILVILYCISLFNIWRREQQERTFQTNAKTPPPCLSATEWSAFTTMTMCISYHRAYDGVLFLPFLGVAFIESMQTLRNNDNSGIAARLYTFCLGSLLLFWAAPLGMVYALQNRIGTLFHFGQSVFIYSDYSVTGYTMMFPLSEIVMLFTTIFFFINCLIKSSAQSKFKGKCVRHHQRTDMEIEKDIQP